MRSPNRVHLLLHRTEVLRMSGCGDVHHSVPEIAWSFWQRGRDLLRSHLARGRGSPSPHCPRSSHRRSSPFDGEIQVTWHLSLLLNIVLIQDYKIWNSQYHVTWCLEFLEFCGKLIDFHTIQKSSFILLQ